MKTRRYFQGMHVVVTDKRVYGPFKTGDDALRWGERNIGMERGWIIRPLEAPDQYLAAS